MKKSFTILIALVVLGAAFNGCYKAPIKRYYTLVNQTAPAGQASPLCAKPLALASVSAEPPYNSTRIVFRTDDYEIKFYNYRFWAAAPEDMMRRLLDEKLSAAGLFTEIQSYIHATDDHLGLFVKIVALEELDDGKDWTGRLAMSFALKDPATEAVLWSHSFDARKKAQARTLVALMEALSQIYNAEFDKMRRSLAAYLANAPICRPSQISGLE